MYLQNRTLGFTLIELMTTVVIVGLLASLAIPSFTKYIRKSRLSEGLLQIRKIYDAEVVFVSSQPFVARTASNDISCNPSPRFSPLCSVWLDGSTYRAFPPPGRKERWYYFGTQKKYIFWGGGASPCNTRPFYKAWGSFDALGLGTLTTANGYFANSEFSYFLPVAKPDPNIAAAYGVNVNDTLTIWSVADLDGDHDGSRASCNIIPYPKTKLSILGRSMYLKNGSIIGLPGIIKENLYE